MFCSKCGASLADDARFCDKCGTATNGTVITTDNNDLKVGTDDTSIDNIDLEKMAKARDLLDTIYDSVNYVIDKYQSKKELLSFKTTIICSAVISFIVWIVIGAIIIGNHLDQVKYFPVCYITPWVVFVVLIVLRCIYIGTLKKNANATIKAALELYDANQSLIEMFPTGYQYPLAADYIYKMIETRRAPTMNKILDKCDEYIHQQKMERMQLMIINNQIEIMDEVRSARNAAVGAAAGSLLNLFL